MKKNTIEAAQKRGGFYRESADCVVIGLRGDDEIRITNGMYTTARFQIGRFVTDKFGQGVWIGKIWSADSIKDAIKIANDLCE